MKPTPCDLTGQPGRPPKARFAEMEKPRLVPAIPTVEVHEPAAVPLLKGAKRITATSYTGARVSWSGVCLRVARQDDSSRHHTIHEHGVPGAHDAIVAIVPDDWALELERNQ